MTVRDDWDEGHLDNDSEDRTMGGKDEDSVGDNDDNRRRCGNNNEMNEKV